MTAMTTLTIDPDTQQVTTNAGNLVLTHKEIPLAAYVQGKGFVRTDTPYDAQAAIKIRNWQGGAKVTIVPQVELQALLS